MSSDAIASSLKLVRYIRLAFKIFVWHLKYLICKLYLFVYLNSIPCSATMRQNCVHTSVCSQCAQYSCKATQCRHRNLSCNVFFKIWSHTNYCRAWHV